MTHEWSYINVQVWKLSSTRIILPHGSLLWISHTMSISCWYKQWFPRSHVLEMDNSILMWRISQPKSTDWKMFSGTPDQLYGIWWFEDSFVSTIKELSNSKEDKDLAWQKLHTVNIANQRIVTNLGKEWKWVRGSPRVSRPKISAIKQKVQWQLGQYDPFEKRM